MRKRLIWTIAITASVLYSAAQEAVCSDQWAATDALGRSVGRYDKTEKDKQVFMFYWTWHERYEAPGTQVKDNSEILKHFPEARYDAQHPAWTKNSCGNYYWGEPIFGYYRTTDTWVLRKHAELLADAKIDGVFFDCTNATATWDASTDSLLATWSEALRDGVKVPKIAFMLPFAPSNNSLTSLRHLYERLYSKGLYKELWLHWNGKPVIMAYPDNLTNSEQDRAIKEFFTFRPGQPDYVNGPNSAYPNQWGWLENYPQHGYIKQPDGTYELVTVGIAQNACPETNGHCSAFNKPGAHSRSYSFKKGFDPRPNGFLYGWNFAEQWERAYELNPKAVFITGWNEWIAGKYSPENSPWTGEPFSFVDQFDSDRSRDIEPVKTWGDYGDVYYLQLVDRVRKFKGTKPIEKPSPPQTIKMGEWEMWDDVLPYYTSYRGNTKHRNAKASCQYHYVNTTGRNDIIGARVARDNEYIYFYVKTANKLTDQTSPAWMRLLIDIDRNKQTGWQGYDFIVNYKQPKGSKAYVQRSHQNKWIWHDCGEAKLETANNELMLRLPREILNVKGTTLDFEFKWSDNMQDEGNLMDFYVNGDVAPGGRFNYVFSE